MLNQPAFDREGLDFFPPNVDKTTTADADEDRRIGESANRF